MTTTVEDIAKIAPTATKEVFKTMSINIGPQHPATHGTLRLKVELDGEIISSRSIPRLATCTPASRSSASTATTTSSWSSPTA